MDFLEAGQPQHQELMMPFAVGVDELPSNGVENSQSATSYG